MLVSVCVWPPIPDTNTSKHLHVECTISGGFLRIAAFSLFSQSSILPGSTRRVLRRMLPRRGLAVPRSSSVLSLEPPCRQEILTYPSVEMIRQFYNNFCFRTSWQRGTRSLRCEKPRGSRQCAPPRIRRKPPSRSLLSR